MLDLLVSASGGAFFVLAVAWLGRHWLLKRLLGSIEHEYAKRLADHNSELNRHLERYKRELDFIDVFRQSQIEIKREACLSALRVVDTHHALLKWEYTPETQGLVDIAVARDCYNKLALVCETSAVLQQYKRCLGLTGEPIIGDMIVDLRNAIRTELGYANLVDTDRKFAWIGRLSPPDASEDLA